MYQIHMLRYYSETCCNSKHTYNSKDTPRVKISIKALTYSIILLELINLSIQYDE